jgi:CDP-diacylglycerol--glycerol-3-phosphate 3-phosphatidyltransferase
MTMVQLRDRVRIVGQPVALFFGRLGLTPNGLTLLGFAITVAGAALAAFDIWLAAAFVVLIGGAFDMFDGSLARATGKASNTGAFLDSVFDRWGEAVVYIGIIAGCLSAGDRLGAGLAAFAMASAFMVSYARARAESLGFAPGKGMAAVGLAPREIRLVILTLGLLAAGLTGGVQGSDGSRPLWLALGLIGVLATITVIQRIIHVTNQAAPTDGK